LTVSERESDDEIYDQCCPGEKYAQHTVRIVENVREETVVPVSSQLRRREIVGGVQTKPDSTSKRCFETLLIGHNMPVMHTTLLQQLGEDDGLVDGSQRVFAHAVLVQQFHGVGTVANNATDVLASAGIAKSCAVAPALC